MLFSNCHSERSEAKRSEVEESLTISSSSSAEKSEILRLRFASLRMTTFFLQGARRG
jgi:hypothetical protein